MRGRNPVRQERRRCVNEKPRYPADLCPIYRAGAVLNSVVGDYILARAVRRIKPLTD